jgi:hypothetical protein
VPLSRLSLPTSKSSFRNGSKRPKNSAAPSPPRAAASPSLKSQRPHPLKCQMPKGAPPALYYQGRRFQTLSGSGFKANYFDCESGEHYWFSGCKKRGGDRLYAGTVEIDADVREEYLERGSRSTRTENSRTDSLPWEAPLRPTQFLWAVRMALGTDYLDAVKFLLRLLATHSTVLTNNTITINQSAATTRAPQ